MGYAPILRLAETVELNSKHTESIFVTQSVDLQLTIRRYSNELASVNQNYIICKTLVLCLVYLVNIIKNTEIG